MSISQPAAGRPATTRVPLRILGEEHALDVPALSGPRRLTELLVVARALSDQAEQVIADEHRAQGMPISCRAGCSACCFNLVAVSLPETFDLADLVADLPEPRQQAVRRRFAASLTRLEQEGLLERAGVLGHRSLTMESRGNAGATLDELSRRYFRLHLPCPFLEDDRCTVYERRPMFCREHRVVSPPENCADWENRNVLAVDTGLKMTKAVIHVAADAVGGRPMSIPLVLALEHAQAHAGDLDRCFDGEQLFMDLLAEIDPAQVDSPVKGGADPGRAATPLPEGVSKAETLVASVDLTVAGRRLQANIEVPAGPTQLLQLLPIARSLSQVSVSAAAEDAAASGMPVTCKAGCGACCRQLVPLTLPEAQRIGELVESLPEPRRSQVRARFAAAQQRLAEANVLKSAAETLLVGPGEMLPHGREYFSLGIACPFLENESCSIYEERPLICRQYVVVSPAECCSHQGWGGVQVLRLPLDVWRAYARVARPTQDKTQDHRAAFVPLVLAPQWLEKHKEERPTRTGPELLQEFFGELTGKAAETSKNEGGGAVSVPP